MRHILYIILVWIGVGVMMVSCSGRKDKARFMQADSLNRVAYALHYKDLAASTRAAVRACELGKGNGEIISEALNNMGFCAFMRMDFEHAARLFERAADEGGNEVEHLIADVGMMKICQRTSMNKRFYDYRNSAISRMKRIREDEALITDSHIKERFVYAVSEFYIVSGIYFYYLQQTKESMESIDAIDERALAADTAQSLYYEYMRGSGGMYAASSEEERVVGEFGCLADCLLLSRSKGYVYFEANALQGMAEILNFPDNRRILESDHLGLLRLVNDKGLPVDSLPLYYANQALSLFKRYGDWYQISGTYRTLATYYNYEGQPDKALTELKSALQYVNWHHEKFYHCKDTTDRLHTYAPQEDSATELKWIVNEGIKTVPEWILRLREQMSRTYAAMDMKPQSDYNRNIYLDLLDYTRQDKSVESRYAALQRESKQLNLLLLLVGIGFCVLIFLFVLLSRRWRERNQAYLATLNKVLDLCRKITASVPAHSSTEEEMVQAVIQTVKNDFSDLFVADDMLIETCSSSETEDEEDEIDEERREAISRMSGFDLITSDKGEKIGVLYLSLSAPLPKEKRALLNLILPYLTWTIENGMNLVSLDDECRRIEKERFVHQQHLAENKRQNIVKKACISIVTGILPYIDRVANEVHKLRNLPYARQENIKKGKFTYIGELIDRINEYNDILALWIKMRQGALSFKIENFGLNDLFAMVAKGKHTFDTKHINLTVSPTEAVVKADKALTLFMVNTLADNARKYTQAGGNVSVYATEHDDYVEISVTDDGPGLSKEDISRILDEKVYDSGAIGLDTAKDVEQLRKSKGHGFGLMNCKGIIEKYRKTNALFSVCMFAIDSTPGKGSRFYFRLPKGVKKAFTMCVAFLFLLVGSSCSHQQQSGEGTVENFAYDSLLSTANEYANLVYNSNVHGEYNKAIQYADSALHYMNAYYLRHSGKAEPLLQLCADGENAAEQTWLAQGFDTDYYILLDVRNETAVAALAVKDFRLYYYNNMAYSVLYKQISKDRSIDVYCEQMQQSAKDKMIALALFVLLVVACIIGYYFLYLRHRLHYRYNMEQVFVVNKALLAVSRAEGRDDFATSLLNCLYTELNELLPVDDLSLAISDEGPLKYYTYQQKPTDDVLTERMQRCFERKEKHWDGVGKWSFFPLTVELGGEQYCSGVLALKIAQPYNNEENKLLVELAISYLSVVLYNTVVRVRQKYADIELMQDEARRTLYEDNMLHVQNMVLDNCLSTIKHETIYYPNRIKKIVDSLNGDASVSAEKERTDMQTIDELVSYYKDIFTLLSSCASRQLDEVTFRRTDISVCALLDKVDKMMRKQFRKHTSTVECTVLPPESEMKAKGDETLLLFLFEILIAEAVRCPDAGRIEIEARRDADFVRFSFTDRRREYTRIELNELFYPSLHHLSGMAGGSELVGTEFLVCKQIIRDHDEYAGRRGCRINADPAPGGGYAVWFTVPLRK